MPRSNQTRPRLISLIREQLFADLGHQCSVAEEQGHECDGPLEIDHPFGRDWTPRKVSSYGRWLRYRKEHQQGLIRLLCRYHNEVIRPRPIPAPATLLPEPF